MGKSVAKRIQGKVEFPDRIFSKNEMISWPHGIQGPQGLISICVRR